MQNAPDLVRGAGSQSEVNLGSVDDSSVLTLPASLLQEKTCLFSEWQPVYAKRGIATFPVEVVGKGKKPCVRSYHKVGLPGSAQLASKFANANAFGFMCGAPNGITIVDMDSSNILVVEEAIKLFGQSPVLWRTGGSGHYAMPFRYNGERRSIRPIPGIDIDILGDGGFVVAPPSIGTNGTYEFIQGSIADFACLPTLSIAFDPIGRGRTIPTGQRNNTVWGSLMRQARCCDDFDSLLDVAMTLNMDCEPPLSDAEVVKIAKSVWGYETSGKNWVGRKARASTDREEILSLSHNPYAAMLLNLLRVSHPMPDARFAIDQRKTAELLRWARNTLKGCIEVLIQARALERVHYGKGLGDPHLYKLL